MPLGPFAVHALEANRLGHGCGAGQPVVLRTAVGGNIILDIIPAKKLYKVLGPPKLLRWLVDVGAGRSGELSHVQTCTRETAARRKLGTPQDARYYCFLSALPRTSSALCPVPDDADFAVLLGGGFCYFGMLFPEGSAGCVSPGHTVGSVAAHQLVTTPGVQTPWVGSGPASALSAGAPDGLHSTTQSAGRMVSITPAAGPRSTAVQHAGRDNTYDALYLISLNRLCPAAADPQGPPPSGIIHCDGPHKIPAELAQEILSSGRLRHPGIFEDAGARFAAWLPPSTRVDPPCSYGAWCLVMSPPPGGCVDAASFTYWRVLPDAPGGDDLAGRQPTMPQPLSEAELPFAQRFQISTERLGSGGFGSVFRGVSKQTGAMVAVKVIPLTFRRGNAGDPKDSPVYEQVMREYRFMQELVHPNIVQVFAFEVESGRAMIVMELCENGTLNNLIQSFSAGVPLAALAHTLRQVVHGVRFLHTHNVVHRDLKPANVLCTSGGLVKVADFGAAHRLLDSSATASGAEQEAAPAALTALYAAPEAVRGEVRYSQDVWALGCICLEMARAEAPWAHLLAEGLTQDQVAQRVMQGATHPLPPTLAQPARDLIAACMAQDPGERPNCSTLLGYDLFILDPIQLAGLDQPAASDDIPWAAPVANPGWSAFTAGDSVPFGHTSDSAVMSRTGEAERKPRPLDPDSLGRSPLQEKAQPLLADEPSDSWAPAAEAVPGAPATQPVPLAANGRGCSASSSFQQADVEYLRGIELHKEVDALVRAVLVGRPKTRQDARDLMAAALGRMSSR